MMIQTMNQTMTVPLSMLRKFLKGLHNTNYITPNVKNNTNIISVTVTHNLVCNSFEMDKQTFLEYSNILNKTLK